MFKPENPTDMMSHIYKLSGMHRPKDDADDDDDHELTLANTLANAASSNSNSKLVDADADDADDANVGLEEESDTDATSHTGTNTGSESDATESVSTGLDEDEDDFADLDEEMAVETPAMLAKKVATAASTVANSDAKKKATIANKRALASSKPPKGKATLADITTLQNSYDDIEHAEGGGDSNDSDEEDDDNDDGNNYLRKFETEMHENYIASHHREMMHLNNTEVSALARVVRNTDGAIIDVMHKTMPFLTKYEKTRILGQRAKQLNQGAQPMVPVDKKIIDGYLIAQLELQQKALPFIIRRPLPGGKSEYWRVSDLELI
jgi:DNA-directed RNA polymerase I, II, and III subunit RPABC2